MSAEAGAPESDQWHYCQHEYNHGLCSCETTDPGATLIHDSATEDSVGSCETTGPGAILIQDRVDYGQAQSLSTKVP